MIKGARTRRARAHANNARVSVYEGSTSSLLLENPRWLRAPLAKVIGGGIEDFFWPPPQFFFSIFFQRPLLDFTRDTL